MIELICKDELINRTGAKFTLNKKYEFVFENGFGYYTTDDNKKIQFMNKDVLVKYFALEFQ